jgi:PAS domain S-box-containing protein
VTPFSLCSFSECSKKGSVEAETIEARSTTPKTNEKSIMTAANERENNFLRDGGFMGDLIRSTDWSGSPLGEPQFWPQSLRTALSVCLNSPIVSALYWGPEFRVLYNDAYAPALAERHPHMLGQPLQEVWAEIWDVLGPQLISVVETGHGFSTDRQRLMMNRNGREEETFWFYSFAPIRGEGGNVAGVFISALDLTAQVDAEKALLSSREDLRELNTSLAQQVADRTADRNGLWQLSGDLMLVAKFDGLMTSLNPAWTELLGWPLEDLLGTKFFDLIHPDDLERTIEAAKDIGESGVNFQRFENRYRHQDGSYRFITWTAGGSDGSIVAVGRDDTAEKEKAEALLVAQDQLRQSQKMEAVGQLTGGLAHDFNNLLTGMMGNLELLQLRIARGRLDDLDRFINAAQGAGRRAASLTQRLLAFSRRQTLDPKPTDVNRLIAGLDDMLQRTVGATTEIEIVGAAGLWTARIDALQLENAILNLCINGRDAMPDGGKLTIETANKWIDDRIGKERDLPAGQYISVCVSDTGTGMAPETIQRAFEPFYTTKPLGEGTGLGLSMIYGFAQQSGGQVRIYSELDQGTTVCIYLPRHDGEAPTTDDGFIVQLEQSVDAQTVLVVDDETTIRHLIDEVLGELGYTVIGAADGAAGVKVLQSDARIDLLITDVGLPNGLNGRQVADAGRVLRPGLKVLFITGFAENAAVGNGHLDAGMELLTKPFTLEALSTKVANMLRAS